MKSRLVEYSLLFSDVVAWCFICLLIVGCLSLLMTYQLNLGWYPVLFLLLVPSFASVSTHLFKDVCEFFQSL